MHFWKKDLVYIYLDIHIQYACVSVCVCAYAHRIITEEVGIFTYEPRCRNRENKVDRFHEKPVMKKTEGGQRHK